MAYDHTHLLAFITGVHLADASMFMYIAMTLAVFDITRAVDDRGRVIETKAEFTSGLVR